MVFGNTGVKKAAGTLEPPYAECDPRRPKPKTDVVRDPTLPTWNPLPPYRRVQSYRGKQRMLTFNYGALNSAGVVVLENSTPNSYANAVLQVPHSMLCAILQT